MVSFCNNNKQRRKKMKEDEPILANTFHINHHSNVKRKHSGPKRYIERNPCCCDVSLPMKYVIVTIVFLSVLGMFSTCVAVIFVRFLHDKSQCATLSLDHSETFVLKMESFPQASQFRIVSNGYTKTVLRRSHSQNGTLTVTVNNYAHTRNGLHGMNTDLVFDPETKELVLNTEMTRDHLRNDCLFVERTISLPDTLLVNMRVIFDASSGDVEFLKQVDENPFGYCNDTDYNFNFKSLSIERHSGSISLNSVYCEESLTLVTHRGSIEMNNVFVKGKMLSAKSLRLGDVKYENIYAQNVDVSVDDGDITGQFIYGAPDLQSVSFVSKYGSQSHNRVVSVTNNQRYVTDSGNIHIIMRRNDFEGNFKIVSRRGKVVINNFSTDIINYSIDKESEKQGTITFDSLGLSSQLAITVIRQGSINLILDA